VTREARPAAGAWPPAREARPASWARLLADLAALGPYFAIDIHRVGSAPCPPWRPLGELIGAPDPPDPPQQPDPPDPPQPPEPPDAPEPPEPPDPPQPPDPRDAPDALAGRIGEVRERLAAAAGRPAAAVEFRVAASIAQLGLCARLLSPVLGAAATGRALRLDTGQAWWIPALGGPFRLSLPDTAASGRAESGPAAAAALLAGPVAQVVRAVEAMSVSPRVLWGNVASAVNGAATMIAAARPDLATPAAETAAAMLKYPPLTGTYQGRPLQGFRRRNCCLIYRLSPSAPAYCGDCVLVR
jgi:hypothetical protein